MVTGESKAIQGPAIVEGKQEDDNTDTKSPKKMSKNTKSKSRAASTRRKITTTPGSPTKKILENTKTQPNNDTTATNLNNNNDNTNDKDTKSSTNTENSEITPPSDSIADSRNVIEPES